MGEHDQHSRVNKYEKRRKNSKLLSIFMIIGSIFIVTIIVILAVNWNQTDEKAEHNEDVSVSNNKQIDDQNNDDQKNLHKTQDNQSNDANDEANEKNETTNQNENANDEDSNDDGIRIKQLDEDKENVLDAYTANWPVVKTEQTGDHQIDLHENTQDRNEIIKGISVATQLDVDDMIVWWLEHDGDQKVITTVSDKAQTTTYRTYLAWRDHKGWQPTKIEVLEKNDKKNP